MNAIITRTSVVTETFELRLDSPLWPEGMTDEEKLTGWLFAARQEPDVAFDSMEASSCSSEVILIEGKVK